MSQYHVQRSVYEPRDNLPGSLKALGGHHRHDNLKLSARTNVGGGTAVLTGWPSRGGIIRLVDATPPDFVFLGFNPVDPPLRRDADQEAEDAFCRGLLRLGATWWDSPARRRFVGHVEYGGDEDDCPPNCPHEQLENNGDLEPTSRERGWVKVAWPESQPGKLCVLECEEGVGRRSTSKEGRIPMHPGVISLARTMDERCEVLLKFGGKMWDSIEEYAGPTFLKAWEEGHQGELGPLVKMEFFDPRIYGGHPDEALGYFEGTGSCWISRAEGAQEKQRLETENIRMSSSAASSQKQEGSSQG